MNNSGNHQKRRSWWLTVHDAWLRLSSASITISIPLLTANSMSWTISVGLCDSGRPERGSYTPVSTRNDFQPAAFAPAISGKFLAISTRLSECKMLANPTDLIQGCLMYKLQSSASPTCKIIIEISHHLQPWIYFFLSEEHWEEEFIDDKAYIVGFLSFCVP